MCNITLTRRRGSRPDGARLSCDDFVLELQESQKLLEIQKTISLVKSQELEDSKKRIILLKKTFTHTSTISSGLY